MKLLVAEDDLASRIYLEEILKNAGENAPDESAGEREKPLEDRPKAVRRADKASKAPVSHTPSGRWPSITPGKILLTGLVVFIITALLQIWVLIWLGLGLLVVGYLLFFITPRNVNLEKRWRGQSIEDPPESPWDRFKRWIKS